MAHAKRWLAAILLLASGLAFGQTPLRVATSEGAKPFHALLTAIYKEIGLTPEFVMLPPERALRSLESGEVDADIGRVVGAAANYKNMVETQESLVDLALVALVRKDHKGGEVTAANVKTLSVGIVRGNKMAEAWASKLGVEPTLVSTIPQLLQMVAAGRVDVGFITDAALTLAPDTDVVRQPKALAVARTVHLFGARHAAYVARFDAAVRAMKADGRVNKLLGH